MRGFLGDTPYIKSMDYLKHYNLLMLTRKNRAVDPEKYYEKHHIVMKSMGGDDSTENTVYLTAREHFLAHWLLWRIHRNRPSALAFFTFVNFKSKNHDERGKLSARGFEEARESFSRTQKERMSGKLNSNRSKIVLQYSLDGEFIQEWPSAKEAERQLSIYHITSVCRGERKWAGDFLWKYKTPTIKKSKPYKERISTTRKHREHTNTEKISKAVTGRKWFNDGKKDYFLKPHDIKDGLVLGRLATRKK